MKTVILAGGFGTRISEETETRPKPMIEVGGKPLLWHIMKIYASHGLTDFIVCLGYKAYFIKEYFANYFLHNADVTLHLAENRVEVHSSASEDWSVTLVDTGLHTQTGGRLKRVARYLDPDEPFCMTYGDGVSDIDITELLRFAREKNTLATVTAVQPAGRFGALELEDDLVTSFREKPAGATWMSGGFFVLDPRVLELIEGDDTHWERSPLEALAGQGQLAAYLHEGFWQPVDTLRDKRFLEKLWEEGNPPWRTWA
ncbi:MAG: glucose-1-phosphate cytidylyltransferase [Candidatus Eremiobacteraeota bacterium]|nr:glucose-1-phosphate cytidylyltransferase [Candidatus Eremiobacteraeota bacterium]